MACCYFFLILCCVLRLVPRLVFLPSINYFASLEFDFWSVHGLDRSLVCSWESGHHPFANYCSGRADSGRIQRHKQGKKALTAVPVNPKSCEVALSSSGFLAPQRPKTSRRTVSSDSVDASPDGILSECGNSNHEEGPGP